jgi:hypothetical protein
MDSHEGKRSFLVWFVSDVLPTIPPVVLAPLFLLAGILLYLWRCFHRLSYGVVEAGLGMVGVLLKVPEASKAQEVESWVGLLFAVYIIVRGLDNIGKASKYTDWLKDNWSRYFGQDI